MCVIMQTLVASFYAPQSFNLEEQLSMLMFFNPSAWKLKVTG